MANVNTAVEGQLLKNYLKAVEAGLALSDFDAVLVKEDNELETLIKVAGEEVSQWPLPFATRLVQRRLARLLASRDFRKMAEVMNPWQDRAPFDPKQPTMASLQADEGLAKLGSWSFMMVRSGLVPLMRQGHAARDAVAALCSTFLEVYQDVDFAELGNAASAMLALATSIWRALLALLAPKITPFAQDMVGEDEALKFCIISKTWSAQLNLLFSSLHSCQKHILGLLLFVLQASVAHMTGTSLGGWGESSTRKGEEGKRDTKINVGWCLGQGPEGVVWGYVPEEDVLKLKEASSATRRSMRSMVAVEMMGNEFYRQKLDSYLAVLPALAPSLSSSNMRRSWLRSARWSPGLQRPCSRS